MQSLFAFLSRSVLQEYQVLCRMMIGWSTLQWCAGADTPTDEEEKEAYGVENWWYQEKSTVRQGG
jgi:hypothetical protein